MGADGHLLSIPVDKVPLVYADLNPERIDWSRRTFHGIDLLYSYWDTEGRGECWGTDFHEVPQKIEWLREQIAQRSKPDWRPPSKVFSYARPDELQKQLDELLEKYTAEELALAQRYANFEMWLQGNADDWTVWT